MACREWWWGEMLECEGSEESLGVAMEQQLMAASVETQLRLVMGICGDTRLPSGGSLITTHCEAAGAAQAGGWAHPWKSFGWEGGTKGQKANELGVLSRSW